MSLLPSEPDTSAADSDAEPRVIGVDSDDADDVISALSSETARKLLAELHEEPAPPSKLADRVDTSLQNAQYHLEKLQSAGAVSVVDTAYSAKGREMDVYAPADEPLVIFAGDEDKSSGLKAALSRFLGGFGALAVGSLAIQQLYGSSGGQATDPAATGGADAPAGGPPAAGTATPTGARETAAPQTTPEATEAQQLSDAVVTFSEQNVTVVNESGYEFVFEDNVTSITTGNGTEYQIGDNVTAFADEIIIQTGGNASQAADTAAATGLEPGLAFFLGGLVVLSLWLGVWYARNR